jgi:NAD(P)H-dependent flavin oxidoreductase YrpB (nitropropane dioxygenase family)
MAAQPFGGCLQRLRIDVVQRQGRTALRQHLGRRHADAARRAGDQGRLAGEAHQAGFLATPNIGLAALLVQIRCWVNFQAPSVLAKLNR